MSKLADGPWNSITSFTEVNQSFKFINEDTALTLFNVSSNLTPPANIIHSFQHGKKFNEKINPGGFVPQKPLKRARVHILLESVTYNTNKNKIANYKEHCNFA